MNHAKPFAAAFLALAGLAGAEAQEEQGMTRPVPSAAEGGTVTVEQDDAATGQQQRAIAPPRRSVQQIVGPEPRATAEPPPELTYGQVPTSPAPVAPGAPATGPAPVMPAPVPLNSCTGNFCTDVYGGSYNAGVGSAAINSQGKLCNRVGNTMQCF